MTDTKPREVRELERADLELDLLRDQRVRAAKRVTDLDAKIAAAQPIRDHLARDPRLPDEYRETEAQQRARDNAGQSTVQEARHSLVADTQGRGPDLGDDPDGDVGQTLASPDAPRPADKPARKSTASRLSSNPVPQGHPLDR